MECTEFKRAAGADPQHLSTAARDHMVRCPPCEQYCEQYAQHMLSLDDLLQRALRVPVSSQLPRSSQPHPRSAARWLALAASLLVTVGVVGGIWLALPRSTLASELIEHVSAEQDIVAAAAPLDATELNKALRSSGVRLTRTREHPVWYATSCPFRGREVPHLLVQTAQGRVTVLLLAGVKVRSVQRFDEQGYRGTILPSGPGSIAIIATNQEAIEEATKHVAAAVEWIK
jgi:hypothetical protein